MNRPKSCLRRLKWRIPTHRRGIPDENNRRSACLGEWPGQEFPHRSSTRPEQWLGGEITQRRFHGVSLSDNPPTKQVVDRVAEVCSNGIFHLGGNFGVGRRGEHVQCNSRFSRSHPSARSCASAVEITGHGRRVAGHADGLGIGAVEQREPIAYPSAGARRCITFRGPGLPRYR